MTLLKLSFDDLKVDNSCWEIKLSLNFLLLLAEFTEYRPKRIKKILIEYGLWVELI